MKTTKTTNIERIKREVEAEFPHDYALQQVHIARRLIAQEARRRGGLARFLREEHERRTKKNPVQR